MKTSIKKIKKIKLTISLILIILFIFMPFASIIAQPSSEEGEFIYQWTGNGKNSLDCSKAGEGGRPDDGTGWIHWVFTTKGDSTDATLTLGGSGEGSYKPGEPLEANVWHFYTPYFDVYELTASITLIGGEKGPGVGLVISDYCPGSEQVIPMLTIEKVLLDIEEIQIIESALEFEFKISGGVFAEGQVFSFSVDVPKEFGPDDGLAFDTEYLIEEIESEAYQFISISQSSVTLTEENNNILVTIVNQEEEEETGSIVIEKLVKADADDEEVIPSNKFFYFNIYNNETDELVHGDVELEVIDGVGTVTIDNLPLGVYRVEEVVNGGFEVILDPEDGIVDLNDAEDNKITVVVVNTPRPKLIIEKVLLDSDGVEVENSAVEFTVILDGGLFDEEEIVFSVNEPAVLDFSDGLEFDVIYTVTEVAKDGYIFVSIDPEEAFTLTDEENEVTVTVVNQEEEEEEETGSIVIEKLVKADADDEEVIPSNKFFYFNIYNNETDELVHGDVELEVIDGVGTVTIDNLPLGVYRVEEVVNGGFEVILDPEDGIVDLNDAEDNKITVVVVNTPRPKLIIEKVLLDSDGVEVENSAVEFTVILDGGLFDEEEIVFSVNEPAVLDFSDGLEFDVIYTVTEVAKDGYIFVSIDPEEAFTLTDEENEVTVTVVNRMVSPPPPPPPPPPGPPVIIFTPPVPPQVIVIPPPEPQVSPPPQAAVVEADEEEAVAFFVSPEDPLSEPEEVLFVAPAAPLATPSTGGAYLFMFSLVLVLFGSGVMLRKKFLK